MKNNIKRIFIAIFFTILGFYFRINMLAGRCNWSGDEQYQWEHTIGPFKPFWLRISNGENNCFRGDYFLTYPFVQLFGTNIWGVSIPHMIATLLGFYCLYLICQRHIKTIWGFFMAFMIFTFNNELIYHAFELRPYAVLATLGLAIFYMTETLVSHQYAVSSLKKFFIGSFFWLTILYHAYGILIVALCTVFFVLAERSKFSWSQIFKRIWLFYFILGLTALPIWVWYASYNLGRRISDIILTFEYIPNPMVDTIGFLKGVLGNLMGFKPFYVLLGGPILSILLPHALRLKQLGFALVLIILPISLLLISNLIGGYWFLQRQFIWVTALFGFFVAWCWEGVWMFISTKFFLSKDKACNVRCNTPQNDPTS